MGRACCVGSGGGVGYNRQTQSIPTHPHVRIDDPPRLPAASRRRAAPARRAGAARAACWAAAAAARGQQDETVELDRRAALQRRARRDARGQLYAGDQALRERSSRAFPTAATRSRRSSSRRTRTTAPARPPPPSPPATASSAPTPTIPNVDYAYYLKGLVHFREDQGLIGYVYELDLSEREPKAMRESFAAFKELVAKFPDSQYAEDSIERMRYLTNALATLRGEGRPLLLQPRRLRRRGQPRAGGAHQLSADAGQRGRARRAGQSYDKLGLPQLRDDSRSASSRRRSRRASTSSGRRPRRGGSSGRHGRAGATTAASAPAGAVSAARRRRRRTPRHRPARACAASAAGCARCACRRACR